MEGLGIDLKLLFAQIVNFLVLFFILKKFLYKPILKFLDERKRKIEESLLNAEKINKELANLEEERKRILHHAESDASQIIAESKKLGEEEREKIIEEAKKRSQEEIKKASLLAREELEKARKELRQEAVRLAEAMAKKLLGKLPAKEKHKLIEELV